MKVDLLCMNPELGEIAALARQTEEQGYAALLTAYFAKPPL